VEKNGRELGRAWCSARSGKEGPRKSSPSWNRDCQVEKSRGFRPHERERKKERVTPPDSTEGEINPAKKKGPQGDPRGEKKKIEARGERMKKSTWWTSGLPDVDGVKGTRRKIRGWVEELAERRKKEHTFCSTGKDFIKPETRTDHVKLPQETGINIKRGRKRTILSGQWC